MREFLKPWGQVYNPSFPHSYDSSCTQCYWKLSGIGKEGLLPKGFMTFVIGFTLSAPGSSRSGILGAMIVECPHCFEKYWFHCGEENVKSAIRVGAWPPANSD